MAGAAGSSSTRRPWRGWAWGIAGLSAANTVEGKYFWPADPGPVLESAPVRALVRLDHGAIGLRELSPLEALASSAIMLRQPDLIETCTEGPAFWRKWLRLTASVPCLAVTRSGCLEDLADLVDLLAPYLD
jgi:hypothetical protein